MQINEILVHAFMLVAWGLILQQSCHLKEKYFFFSSFCKDWDCEWDIDPSLTTPDVPFCCGCMLCKICSDLILHARQQPGILVPMMAWMMLKREGGGYATACANGCQRGRISNLKMGRTDRGIMKLLTSKQAAESPADGRADGEGAARLGCEHNGQPDFSWMLGPTRQHSMCLHVWRQICERFGVCLQSFMWELSKSVPCLTRSLFTKVCKILVQYCS